MINSLPAWFKQSVPDEKALTVSRLLSEGGVDTVCKQAKCPNTARCFGNHQATFLILGNACSRNCKFCNMREAEFALSEKRPQQPEDAAFRSESSRVSEAVRSLGLNYAVITSVTRDDLPDGGASRFAETIAAIRGLNRNVKVEVLIPDFQGNASSLRCVLEACPDVLAHNIEMVERLYPDLRPMADYRRSLGVLKETKELKPGIITKSSIMLGLGEVMQEVVSAMEDLKKNRCDMLTLGQYLAPSKDHYPVQEFVDIAQFEEYRDIGLSMGLKAVLSGPLVRSSFRARETYEQAIASSEFVARS